MPPLLTLALLAILNATMTTQDPSAELLLVVKERVRPGHEESYDRIESRIADACARLGCPNPYLALERITGPKEIWWVNAFTSEAHKERIENAYVANEPLMSELLPLSRQKASLTEEPTDVLLRYRRDLSAGLSWKVAGTRLFVVSVAPRQTSAGGAVFEAPDGQLYTFRPAFTRAEAEQTAKMHPNSVIFAIQPRWSLPAHSWIAADSEFWKGRPVARTRGSATSF